MNLYQRREVEVYQWCHFVHNCLTMIVNRSVSKTTRLAPSLSCFLPSGSMVSNKLTQIISFISKTQLPAVVRPMRCNFSLQREWRGLLPANNRFR